MKISKKIVSMIAICTVILSVGCSKPVKTTSTTMENTVINKTNENKYTTQTVEFDVGNEKYISSNKKEMPYKIRGVISVPEGNGKFPVVLIAHGSHENIKEGIRFDTGFKYLTQDLAENGYIAVSMDLSNAYLWKFGDSDDRDKVTTMTNKHIESLKKANEGKIKYYNLDLKDKIDFGKVALIGHSRGGETIFNIASKQEEKGQKISALLPIAPTSTLLDTPYFDTDIATSILVPEYDGDVVDLAGFTIYDILESKKRENSVQLIMLKKGNHNYFNQNIKPNDATMTRIDVSDQLTRKEQEHFLSNYVVDFLDAAIKDDIKNSIYDTNIASPEKMYGYDVKTLYKGIGSKDIVNIEEPNNFKGENVNIEKTQDSWFFKDDKAQGIETITSGNEGFEIRQLLNVKWNEGNGNISFVPNIKNFSDYKNISINVLQDPSDKLNEKGVNQAFTVEFKDREGNVSRVELDKNVRALDYIPGELIATEIEGKIYNSWSCNTPLTEVNIPLRLFKEVDLSKIKEVSLVFDKSGSGSIMIGSFKLNK